MKKNPRTEIQNSDRFLAAICTKLEQIIKFSRKTVVSTLYIKEDVTDENYFADYSSSIYIDRSKNVAVIPKYSTTIKLLKKLVRSKKIDWLYHIARSILASKKICDNSTANLIFNEARKQLSISQLLELLNISIKYGTCDIIHINMALKAISDNYLAIVTIELFGKKFSSNFAFQIAEYIYSELHHENGKLKLYQPDSYTYATFIMIAAHTETPNICMKILTKSISSNSCNIVVINNFLDFLGNICENHINPISGNLFGTKFDKEKPLKVAKFIYDKISNKQSKYLPDITTHKKMFIIYSNCNEYYKAWNILQTKLPKLKHYDNITVNNMLKMLIKSHDCCFSGYFLGKKITQVKAHVLAEQLYNMAPKLFKNLETHKIAISSYAKKSDAKNAWNILIKQLNTNTNNHQLLNAILQNLENIAEGQVSIHICDNTFKNEKSINIARYIFNDLVFGKNYYNSKINPYTLLTGLKLYKDNPKEIATIINKLIYVAFKNDDAYKLFLLALSQLHPNRKEFYNLMSKHDYYYIINKLHISYTKKPYQTPLQIEQAALKFYEQNQAIRLYWQVLLRLINTKTVTTKIITNAVKLLLAHSNTAFSGIILDQNFNNLNGRYFALFIYTLLQNGSLSCKTDKIANDIAIKHFWKSDLHLQAWQIFTKSIKTEIYDNSLLFNFIRLLRQKTDLKLSGEVFGHTFASTPTPIIANILEAILYKNEIKIIMERFNILGQSNFKNLSIYKSKIELQSKKCSLYTNYKKAIFTKNGSFVIPNKFVTQKLIATLKRARQYDKIYLIGLNILKSRYTSEVADNRLIERIFSWCHKKTSPEELLDLFNYITTKKFISAGIITEMLSRLVLYPNSTYTGTILEHEFANSTNLTITKHIHKIAHAKKLDSVISWELATNLFYLYINSNDLEMTWLAFSNLSSIGQVTSQLITSLITILNKQPNIELPVNLFAREIIDKTSITKIKSKDILTLTCNNLLKTNNLLKHNPDLKLYSAILQSHISNGKFNEAWQVFLSCMKQNRYDFVIVYQALKIVLNDKVTELNGKIQDKILNKTPKEEVISILCNLATKAAGGQLGPLKSLFCLLADNIKTMLAWKIYVLIANKKADRKIINHIIYLIGSTPNILLSGSLLGCEFHSVKPIEIAEWHWNKISKNNYPNIQLDSILIATFIHTFANNGQIHLACKIISQTNELNIDIINTMLGFLLKNKNNKITCDLLGKKFVNIPAHHLANFICKNLITDDNDPKIIPNGITCSTVYRYFQNNQDDNLGIIAKSINGTNKTEGETLKLLIRCLASNPYKLIKHNIKSLKTSGESAIAAIQIIYNELIKENNAFGLNLTEYIAILLINIFQENDQLRYSTMVFLEASNKKIITINLVNSFVDALCRSPFTKLTLKSEFGIYNNCYARDIAKAIIDNLLQKNDSFRYLPDAKTHALAIKAHSAQIKPLDAWQHFLTTIKLNPRLVNKITINNILIALLHNESAIITGTIDNELTFNKTKAIDAAIKIYEKLATKPGLLGFNADKQFDTLAIGMYSAANQLQKGFNLFAKHFEQQTYDDLMLCKILQYLCLNKQTKITCKLFTKTTETITGGAIAKQLFAIIYEPPIDKPSIDISPSCHNKIDAIYIKYLVANNDLKTVWHFFQQAINQNIQLVNQVLLTMANSPHKNLKTNKNTIAKSAEIARQIYLKLINKNFNNLHPNMYTHSIAIRLFANLNQYGKAWKIFQQCIRNNNYNTTLINEFLNSLNKNIPGTFNSTINGDKLVNASSLTTAKFIYNQLTDSTSKLTCGANSYSHTIMIKLYAHHKQIQQSWDIFAEQLKQGGLKTGMIVAILNVLIAHPNIEISGEILDIKITTKPALHFAKLIIKMLKNRDNKLNIYLPEVEQLINSTELLPNRSTELAKLLKQPQLLFSAKSNSLLKYNKYDEKELLVEMRRHLLRSKDTVAQLWLVILNVDLSAKTNQNTKIYRILEILNSNKTGQHFISSNNSPELLFARDCKDRSIIEYLTCKTKASNKLANSILIRLLHIPALQFKTLFGKYNPAQREIILYGFATHVSYHLKNMYSNEKTIIHTRKLLSEHHDTDALDNICSSLGNKESKHNLQNILFKYYSNLCNNHKENHQLQLY